MTATDLRILRGGATADPALPLITVDMDGVLSEPLFGWNPTAHGPVSPPDVVPAPNRMQRWLWPAERVRYVGRRSMPGAPAFLAALAPHFRLLLLTARGRPSATHSRGWLKRKGLWRYLDGLVFRAGPLIPSYAFKADAVGQLAPAWHVDDDGRTAVHVAAQTHRPVVLIAWPGNVGQYPEGVFRVADLGAAARFLLSEQRNSATQSSSSSSG